jgi:hypothetical protein
VRQIVLPQLDRQPPTPDPTDLASAGEVGDTDLWLTRGTAARRSLSHTTTCEQQNPGDCGKGLG